MKIFILIFFFWKIWKSWIFFKELKILNIFWKKPKKYESNAPSPKAFFENFPFFFFFENFVNLEFFHGIEIFYWWFFFEKFRNLEFFQGIENLEFFWKKPKMYEPNAPSPKAFFENFVFFFFFEIWRFVHYQKSEEDEDEDGVKVMKIYSWWFFFFFWKSLSFEWEKLWLEVYVDCWISPYSIPAKR